MGTAKKPPSHPQPILNTPQPTHKAICLPASTEGQEEQWNCIRKTGLQIELFQESKIKKYQPSTGGLLFLALKTTSFSLL